VLLPQVPVALFAKQLVLIVLVYTSAFKASLKDIAEEADRCCSRFMADGRCHETRRDSDSMGARGAVGLFDDRCERRREVLIVKILLLRGQRTDEVKEDILMMVKEGWA